MTAVQAVQIDQTTGHMHAITRRPHANLAQQTPA